MEHKKEKKREAFYPGFIKNPLFRVQRGLEPSIEPVWWNDVASSGLNRIRAEEAPLRLPHPKLDTGYYSLS